MNPTFTNTGALDKAVLNRYLSLPQPDDKVLATYIWIDGTGEHLRGNTSLTVHLIFIHPFTFLFIS